jgi:heptosyltransferase III
VETSNVLQRLPSGARVAVIRLRSLGDCVLTTPALEMLKGARPDLEVAVVVEDAFVPVFAGNPAVDRMLAPRAADIARWNPRLTINAHGGANSALLTLASRARIRAGFGHFRFPSIYNIRIPRAQEILGEERKVHTAEHLASAMFYLGAPVTEIPRARLFANRRPLPDGRGSVTRVGANPYAVVHPMASAADKTWPADRFREAAGLIATRFGLDPVFIAGPGESLAAFEGHACMAGASLEEIKSLLVGASLFLGNDSGPAHMAAAFGLPVIALFGSSDPDNWRPWKTESAVFVGDPSISSIRVSDIVEAAGRLVPQGAARTGDSR